MGVAMLKNCIKSIYLFTFIFLAGCSPKDFSVLTKSPVPFFQDKFGLKVLGGGWIKN